MSQVELTKEKLTALMREAEQAHHDYETKLGHPDADWPAWYASFIMDELEGKP